MEKDRPNPLIIAGPCALETQEQFYSTVHSIYNYTDIIRVGVWKARTSPKNYPGIGHKGLPWIQSVQKKYKTPVAIEIGTPQHVEFALKYDVRFFWLGARTTVNPFYVQEIAESLRGVSVEVWVKNPIFADVKLWTGAIERLKRVGLKNIKIIHRGFHSEKKMIYRNNPKWSLVNAFRRNHPSIPVICDPSHIAGNKKHIYELARRACGQRVDGLMIEVHNSPSNALSDSAQQLSPKEFKQLLARLKYAS